MKQVCVLTTNANSNVEKPVAKTKTTDTENTGISATDNKNENKTVCHCCILTPSKDNELEFLYAFTSICVKDNILPQSFVKGKF